MKRIFLLAILLATTLTQSCNEASAESPPGPCSRIEVEFLHDYEPIMKVRNEVVGPVEDYYNSQPGIDQVTMSVIGNSARISLNYNHLKVSSETVKGVYQQLQKMMKDGSLPDYLEGPFVAGCGVSYPEGKQDELIVYKSLEDALKTPEKVYKLDLYYQKMTELPASIGKLKNLTWLRLGGNKLTSLPDEIGKLTQLRVLNLERNNLSSLPESIGKLGKLKTLILEDNQLSSLPGSMSKLSSLDKLNLRDNKFAELPDVVGKIENLTFLDIARNQMTTLPGSIGGLKQLDFLNACSNSIKVLPESIGDLENVTKIYLSDNGLKKIPSTMSKLPKLTALYMEANYLTSEEKEAILNLLPNIKVKF